MSSGRKAAGIAAALVLVVAGAGGGAVLVAQADAATHTVVAVNGDAISLTDGSTTADYTLAGVALPVPGAEQGPAGCLASEAGAYLAGMLPPGTKVRAAPAEGLQDAVTLWVNERVVNVEVVRAGLAATATAGVPDALAADLDRAAAQAADAGRGLHADSVACSVPGRVAAFERNVAAAAAEPAPEKMTAALDARIAGLQSLRAEADGIAAILAGDVSTLPLTVHSDQVRRDLSARLTAASSVLQQLQDTAGAQLDALKAEQEAAAARAAAEKAQAERERAEQDEPLFVPPADGVYDCIAPWDHAESWTQEEEDWYYACVATIP